MEVKQIDLSKYKSPNSKLYSGRNRGEAVRKKLKLDELDLKENVKVKINIPKETSSINTSFFLATFGKSVRKLGKKKFLEKYEFDCPEVIKTDIEEGIDRALKKSNLF